MEVRATMSEADVVGQKDVDSSKALDELGLLIGFQLEDGM